MLRGSPLPKLRGGMISKGLQWIGGDGDGGSKLLEAIFVSNLSFGSKQVQQQ